MCLLKFSIKSVVLAVLQYVEDKWDKIGSQNALKNYIDAVVVFLWNN